MKKRIAFILLLSLLPLAIAFFQMHHDWRPDTVVDGVADMRQIFDKDEIYYLRGQWECYPGQLLAPGQFAGKQPELVNVPAPLFDASRRKQTMGQDSVATYRLRLLLPPEKLRLALTTYIIRSAARIYLNGDLAIEQGVVTEDFAKFVAYNRPAKCFFNNIADNEIIIQVANHDVGTAGLISAPGFAIEARSTTERRAEVFCDAIIVVSGLLVFVVFAGTFFQRRQQRELLYFGLFCIALVIVFSLVNEKLFYDIYADLNYTFAIRLAMLGIVVAVVCYAQYIFAVLEASRYIEKINISAGAALALGVAVLPIRLVSSLPMLFLVVVWAVMVLAAMLYYVTVDLRQNSDSAWYLIFGLSNVCALFAVSVINVVGYINSVRTVVWLVSLLLVSQLLFINNRQRKLEIRESLLASELRGLRSQMNPHFVYNTMASIAGMIKTEPEAARQVLTDFSQFFRKLIKPTRDGYQSNLQEEIELTEYYLRIEQMRFAERLQVNVNIPSELLSLSIPALVIQPLVENSIKHNLEKNKVLRLKLSIAAKREQENLVITVLDNGIGMTAAEVRELGKRNASGIGLRNIRERLQFSGGQLKLSYSSGVMKAIVTIKIVPTEGSNA